LQRGAAVTQHRTDELLNASWDDLKIVSGLCEIQEFSQRPPKCLA